MPHRARLAQRAILVTGGSRGIGRAAALRFAEEGASVALVHLADGDAAGRVLDALSEASRAGGHSGRRHIALDADIAAHDAPDLIFARAIAEYGRIDALVNNAGVQAPTPSDSFDDDALRRILEVDLVAVARLCRAALRHFGSRPGGGVIVNTSSVHELIPKPGYLAYAMAKSGLGALTRTLALEGAARGIRVNSVAPGAVTTDMNAGWTGDAQKRRAVEAHIPMGRAASAEEIAPLFAFLVSDEASYITGQTIHACGGLTLYADFAQNWSS